MEALGSHGCDESLLVRLRAYLGELSHGQLANSLRLTTPALSRKVVERDLFRSARNAEPGRAREHGPAGLLPGESTTAMAIARGMSKREVEFSGNSPLGGLKTTDRLKLDPLNPLLTLNRRFCSVTRTRNALKFDDNNCGIW